MSQVVTGSSIAHIEHVLVLLAVALTVHVSAGGCHCE